MKKTHLSASVTLVATLLAGCQLTGTPAALQVGDSAADIPPPSSPLSIPGDDPDEGERGIGGSGVRLADERGIGGSGIRLADERGIGGSGKQPSPHQDEDAQQLTERGIGGSGRRQQTEQTSKWLQQLAEGEKIGVAGTLNDFGSIWVNGLHIQYNDQTPVMTDTGPGHTSQLQPGQQLTVIAARRNDQLVAERIDIIEAVAGPVSSVDATNRQITVLGQNIQLSERMVLPDTGEWVSVAGPRDASQQIQASHVASIAPRQQVTLRGYAEQRAGLINIGGLQTASPVSSREVSYNRQHVLLRADYSSGQIQNVRIARVQRLATHDGVRLISVERHASALNRPGPWSRMTTPATRSLNGSRIIEASVLNRVHTRPDQVMPKPPINWQAQPPRHSKAHRPPAPHKGIHPGPTMPAPHNAMERPPHSGKAQAPAPERPPARAALTQSRPDRAKRVRPDRLRPVARMSPAERPARPAPPPRPQRPGRPKH